MTADLIASVRLSLVDGVGPRLQRALLGSFGTADGVLAASAHDLLRVPGIGAKLARRIASATREIDAEAEIELANEHGIEIVTEDDASYPRLLREIHDPPALFYRLGQRQSDDELAIAIVGTRHATHYGLKQAALLATELCRAGFTIVSGLARGIDAAAHQATLAAGGRTIAVLAGGLLEMYPAEHADLADQVTANGQLLSEAPPRRMPLPGAFPQRNRIISGLTVGTIVVEAPPGSGALITARHAGEQGREVFALPGPVDSRASRGTNGLIRDGATLVETVDDVLAELGPLVEEVRRDDGTTVRQPAELALNDVEQKVLQAIDTTPTSIDTVVQLCDLPIHRVLSTISVLEMRRLVRRVSGNLVARM